MLRDFEQLRAIFWDAVRRHVRGRRFAALLAFVLLDAALIIGLYLSGALAKPSTGVEFAQAYLGLNSALLFVIGPALGGDILSDLSSRPGLFLLTQPVRRRTILSGRLLAAFAIGSVIVAAYYLACVAGLRILGLPVPASILASFALALLLLTAVVGVAVLFGSVFRNGSTAIAATVLVLVVGSFGTQSFLEQASVEPWFLLTYATRVLTAVLPPSYPPHSQEVVQRGGFVLTFVPYLWEGVVLMIMYLLVSIVSAFVVFARREVA